VSLKVIVVDDEPLARRRILRLLRSEPGFEVVRECASGQEAIDAIRGEPPDIVFLDVQMPEVDGFDVLAAVGPERMPAVIFVTAYDQYAIRAFEVHALDYLLKPFDADRFRSALQRAKSHIDRAAQNHQSERFLALLEHLTAEQRELEERVSRSAGGRYVDRLMIKSGGRMFFAKVSEIDWIEAAGNYVRLHFGREAHLVRETMASLEAKLDPAQFLRIHRSTIVNLDRVKEMQPWFSGEYTVILRDGTQLRLSRGYRDKLEERLGRPS
jgi:two-component system, LytTR family, response regulator